MTKLDKQWVSWQCSTIAQVHAQDVDNVHDLTYHPSTPEDKQRFDEKQKYVYVVFEQKIQTDKGKALVQEYEATLDAQAFILLSSIIILSWSRHCSTSPS